MSRRRSLATTVAAVLALGLGLVRPPPARGDTCAPAARLAGDDALVAPIASLLQARGVAIDDGGAAAECAVHAEVRRDQRQVWVRITDADGRTVERVTSDVDSAATAIESWARRDLGDPLLEREPRPAEPRAAGAGARRKARRVELVAAFGGGLSEDRGVWGVAHVAACVTVGDTCVGALIAFASDTGMAGTSEDLRTDRRARDLVLVAGRRLELDRWSLVPQFGIGQTSLTATRALPDMREREQTTSLFVHAAMGLGLRVYGRWSARLDGAVAVAPGATRRLGEEDVLAPQLAALPYVRGSLALGLAYGGL